MKRIFTLMALALAICGCKDNWTEEEVGIIYGTGSRFHVYTIDNPQENRILHEKSKDLTDSMIVSLQYDVMVRKMISTLKAPATEGVGIAGLQIGVLRRVVVVMRYDKPGIPYEAYPNIRIIEMNGETKASEEGCLSVPDQKHTVQRYNDIVISYRSPETLKDTTEHITGFTAVIFQHECDHLDGILYTEKQ